MEIDNMVGLGLRSRESAEQLREALVGQLNTGELRFPAKSFFVDDSIGSDTANDGLSPDRPFKTITKGINAARCKEANSSAASIRTRNHSAWVFVAPGHYNEQLIFDATHGDKLFGIHVIGLAHGRPGGDYGVVINQDGTEDDANGVVCIQGNGNHLANLFIKVGAHAIPGIHLASAKLGDNNLIENCVIEGEGTMTYGILAGSLKGTTIKDCYISGAATAGIRLQYVSGAYAIAGAIKNNTISCAGVGILIDGAVASYAFEIDRNRVVVTAGAGKGIDDNSEGGIMVIDNYVKTQSGVPVESANGTILGNHTCDSSDTVDPNKVAGTAAC